MSKIIPLTPSTMIVDPEDLYVPPTAKGEGVAAAGRIDKVMKARIAAVVQSPEFSRIFRTESDLLRSAIQWFMDQVIAPKMGGQFLDDQKQTTFFVRQHQATARLQNATKFFTEMKEVILNHEGEGSHDYALGAYREAVAHAEERSEPFKGRALRLLREDKQLGAVRRRAEEDDEVIAVDRKIAA